MPELSGVESAAELRDMANSDPARALAAADSALRSSLDPAFHSEVLRAKAIAHRVLGDLDAASSAGLASLTQAQEAQDHELARLASMTLAPIHAQKGELHEAIRLLAIAEDGAPSIEKAEVQFQRAGILGLIGRFADSTSEYSKAIDQFRSGAPPAWLADALMSRGTAYAYCGAVDLAAVDLAEARSLFVDLGDDVGVGSVVHNGALAAFTAGDPARAVVEFDEAAQLLGQSGFPIDLYRSDQCEALLAAGLNAEALALGLQGVQALEEVGNVLEAATQRLTLAQALFRLGDLEDARVQANAARLAFLSQGQDRRADNAELLLLRAKLTGETGRSDAERVANGAAKIGERFRGSDHAEWRAAALLVEAFAHVIAGRDDKAHQALTRVARQHHSFVQELERLSLEASLAARQGRRGSALRYCRRAVRSVHVANTLAGSTLVRSAMSRHLDVVVAIGVQSLLQGGRARDAMCLIEQAQAQIGQTSSNASSAHFAEHRALTRAIAEASNERRDNTDMLKRRRTLEHEIRAARTHLAHAAPLPAAELASGATIRRYVIVNGSLVALDLKRGRATAQQLGEVTVISALIDELLFLLTRSLRSTEVAEGLELVANELDLALGQPGEVAGPDGALHLIPAAGLPSFPFGLLPSLRAVPWVNVQRSTRPGSRRTQTHGIDIALAGSGLAHARAEIEKVSETSGGAVTAIRGHTTCDEALGLMNEASFAHIAAHSTINPGNIMFSSIMMSDGDLSLHELEGIEHPPATVVLASCDSAVTEQVGSASIGLATGLLAAGIQTVVATGCEIPDSIDTVTVMAHLHASGVVADPVRALSNTVTSSALTDAQRLIAQCLVVCSEHPLSSG